ncbi:MAG: fibronectin type III domain-containing protein [Planctomycetota bacterium]
MEPLEKREVLSAAGLVDVGSQPSGALDGKIVYIHGGHGITATDSGWGYQRPLLLDMNEDLGNQDQLTYFADSLWRAGATVVPLRPIGHQPNEFVLDNDDVEVTFQGPWNDSSASVYFGSAGDVSYRFANTSATETATAQYRPNIADAGFYPVYGWSSSGGNRATDQLYRVHHAGGATEVTVNHRRVGNGLVYLGTYYFEEGNGGYVEISNRSDDAGSVVIADMIRFGNGVGDLNFGNGVSGEVRENEAGLYWLQWHVQRSQGISPSTYGTSTVTAPNRYAAYMNREADGSLSDRVFVSYHSNATTGNPNTATARGVIALHNTPNGGATPNQLLLAQELASEINTDLVAQNGQFEHNWQSRSSLTFAAGFNYGEINNSIIGNEFDATIVETGFHDNTLDAEMLRDPRVRDALARATTQGLIDYFRAVDGNTTPNVDAPPMVTELSGEATDTGEVTLTWAPGTPSAFAGGNQTGFMIYASTNGYGFDGGTLVSDFSATSHTLTGLDPNETYYFKVAAVNAGGESSGSEVVAVRPSADTQRVLIVNGFDRLERTNVDEEPFRNSSVTTIDRVRPRLTNSMDYSVQIAEAMAEANADAAISTVSNEGLQAGVVNVLDYDAIFWIAGEESTNNDTFNALEQALVTGYLTSGGKLFVSGSEIGWDLEARGNGAAFYNNTLRADFVADDANTYNAAGAAGSIFEGLGFTFDDGQVFYDVNFPDVIQPAAGGGATLAATYAGGAGAGIQYEGGAGEKLVMLAFPFETVLDADIRTQAMSRVLDFFEIDNTPPIVVTKQTEFILDNDDGASVFSTTGSWIDPGPFAFDFKTQLFNLVGADGATATWETVLPEGGTVDVFSWHSQGGSRATNAYFDVTATGSSFIGGVNQQVNGFQWVFMGSTEADAGPISITLDADRSSGAGGSVVIADAIRLVVSTPIEANGDFNGDTFVDLADYTVWRDNLNATVTPGTLGDADFDGVVTESDYDIWVSTFGQTFPAPAAAFALAIEDDGVAPIETESTAPSGSSFALAVATLEEEATVAEPTRRERLAAGDSPRARRAALLLAARAERVAEAVVAEPDGLTAAEEPAEESPLREAFAGFSRAARRFR